MTHVESNSQFVGSRNNHTLLRYFQNIETRFSTIDQPNKSAPPLNFRSTFALPRLTAYKKGQPETTSSEPSIFSLLADHSYIALIGDHGAGKTTLLTMLMLAFSYYTKNLTKIALGERVPFLLTLSELSFAGPLDWDRLWSIYLSSNKDSLTEPLINDNAIVDQVLSSGQALIMLDGLDAIADNERRKQLLLALQEGMSRYPHCLFLVTTNLAGFHEALWPTLGQQPIEPYLIEAPAKINEQDTLTAQATWRHVPA